MAAQVLMNKAVRPAMPVRAARTTTRVSAVARPADMKKAGAALVAISTLAQAQPVLAQEADAVDSAINTVIDVVKATGGAVKTGVDAVSTGVKIVQQGIEVATPVVKQGYEAVAPVVSQAAKVAGDVAVPALKAAAPSLEEATKAIKNSGVDVTAISSTTDAVVKTTASGITTATPVVQSFFSYLVAQDAVTLGEYALGAVAVYFLLPPTLGAIFGSLRGFAGEITAATALDALANEGNSVLIDIRTGKEKEGSGVPDVPSGAGSKLVEVEFASTDDKKLRGQLRDAFAIEAQVTALQIASLKKLGKGSKIILLDRYGGLSKTVAKELSRKGYGKVYVVSGGFDGRGGWVQSKLQIKPYTVVSGATAPAPVFGTLAKTISTRVANKRALPAPKA